MCQLCHIKGAVLYNGYKNLCDDCWSPLHHIRCRLSHIERYNRITSDVDSIIHYDDHLGYELSGLNKIKEIAKIQSELVKIKVKEALLRVNDSIIKEIKDTANKDTLEFIQSVLDLRLKTKDPKHD